MFAAAPLALIEQYKTEEPNYAEWVQWGNEILTTGIFCIIICGTLGVLGIHLLSQRCLEKARRWGVYPPHTQVCGVFCGRVCVGGVMRQLPCEKNSPLTPDTWLLCAGRGRGGSEFQEDRTARPTAAWHHHQHVHGPARGLG